MLGIARTASAEEIKQAVIDKSKQYRSRINHPDMRKRQSAERILAMIQKAKSVLLDPERRREYDALLAARAPGGPAPAADLSDRAAAIDSINELLERGRAFEAIPLAKRAVETWPQDADAWAALAYAHAQWGDVEDAVYELKKAVEFDPSRAGMHFDLGTMYADSQRWDEAMKCFQRAAQIDPAERAYRFGQARVYFACGQYQEAVNILEPLYGEETAPMQKANYAYWLALAHNDWGAHLQNEVGNLKLAFEHYHRASQIPFQDADLRGIVRYNLTQMRAAPGQRFKAFVADSVLVLIAWFVLEAALGYFGSFLSLIGVPAYYILTTAYMGKTLGKAIFSMRVVDDDGNMITIQASAIRFVGFAVTMFSCAFLVVLFAFVPMLGDKKQTVYDMIAKTQVVNG